MKKILLTGAALLSTTSLAMAGPTMNQEPAMNSDRSNFYIGADVGQNKTKFKPAIEGYAKDKRTMFNGYVGYKFNEHFALEVGAFGTKNDKVTVGSDVSKTKESGMYLDAVGTHQLGQSGFNVLGSAGVQYSKLKVKGVPSNEVDSKEFVPRLGAGLEYAFTDSLKARGVVRYIFADQKGNSDRNMQYTLGLNYRF